MHIVGPFRDLGDPDRFVWLRGFESMAARKQALSDFYGGPVWRQHPPRLATHLQPPPNPHRSRRPPTHLPRQQRCWALHLGEEGIRGCNRPP
jgi:hypothetical protein